MSECEFLTAALAYARLGWPVMPVGAGAKKKGPFIPDWPNAASTDPDQIRRWWRQFPRAKIGAVTGARSGFWVLDVDRSSERGIDGFDSLARLEAIVGPIPRDVVSITPSGGMHIFLKYNQSMKSSAGKLPDMPGLDIRADGGQVILPPSVNEHGQRYEWRDAQ